MTDNSSAGLKKAVGIYAAIQTCPEQDTNLIKLQSVLVLWGVRHWLYGEPERRRDLWPESAPPSGELGIDFGRNTSHGHWTQLLLPYFLLGFLEVFLQFQLKSSHTSVWSLFFTKSTAQLLQGQKG